MCVIAFVEGVYSIGAVVGAVSNELSDVDAAAAGVCALRGPCGCDVAAFTEESYPQPGVPQGKLTGPITIESKLYPGLKARTWYYVPAQWDGHTPLPVTWCGDGQFYTAAHPDAYRMLDAFDNLFTEKRIPLMANVFVEPGTAPERNIRSIEYDTVSDKLGHSPAGRFSR